jgi:hypothetical protein
MPFGNRTPEQLNADREKAIAVRRARAALKADLKTGRRSLEDVIEGDLDIAKKMKVSAVLTALPKVGKVKAADIMTELEIAPTRKVGGLGARQRRALAERFGYTARV